MPPCPRFIDLYLNLEPGRFLDVLNELLQVGTQSGEVVLNHGGWCSGRPALESEAKILVAPRPVSANKVPIFTGRRRYSCSNSDLKPSVVFNCHVPVRVRHVVVRHRVERAAGDLCATLSVGKGGRGLLDRRVLRSPPSVTATGRSPRSLRAKPQHGCTDEGAAANEYDYPGKAHLRRRAIDECAASGTPPVEFPVEKYRTLQAPGRTEIRGAARRPERGKGLNGGETAQNGKGACNGRALSQRVGARLRAGRKGWPSTSTHLARTAG